MKNLKKQTGIVINCYDYDSRHRVLVVLSNDKPMNYHFFFVTKNPAIDFGDKIQMFPADHKYYVCRGNPKLTYRFFPRDFPDTLLLELISEYINQ